MINTTKIDNALQIFSTLPKKLQLEVINELKTLEEKITEKEFFKDLPKKKSLSPPFLLWKYCVPELKNIKGLNSWKDACKFLRLNATGDSARRVLKRWAKIHRPEWHEIPEPMKLENNYATY